ncbi:hypothetical protein ACU686_18415 [Yinghuangia aomiensis]
MSREDIFGAAAALADKIAGSPAVAVRATASLGTVVATSPGSPPEVPVVPVPPDSGGRARAHPRRLRRGPAAGPGGPGAWDDITLPVVPVDTAARAACSHPEPGPRTAPRCPHQRNDRGTQGSPPPRRVAADLDALADAWAWTPDVLVHGLPLFHVHQDWCSACWARCAPGRGWCTPGGRRPRPTRKRAGPVPACPRCGRVSPRTRPRRRRLTGSPAAGVGQRPAAGSRWADRLAALTRHAPVERWP